MAAGLSGNHEFVEVDPSGRYFRNDEILGRGAFKTVYRAFDKTSGIEVAWNQLSMEEALQSQELLEKLYAEVHLVKSLKHENVIRLYHYWIDDKKRTINMITELFTSGTLRQYCKKHNNIDTSAIKGWGIQILRGINYLHTHNPTIIHRDLKCDNLFVNGNTGEVKIGDLGLAIVMHGAVARSVVGTPEFMAPEIYDEEYNQLADIYAFGMCLLEMVTREYPYSECQNQAQIYRRVSSGVKPSSLSKVKDPQVKDIIEKCIAPVSARLSAAQLLRDPFFADEIARELSSGGDAQMKNLLPKQAALLPQSECHAMDIDTNHKKPSSGPFAGNSHESPQHPIVELRRQTDDNDFTLRGETTDDHTLSLTMRISYPSGEVKNISFPFYLDSDTSLTIAGEMVEQFNLSSEETSAISELIDALIVMFVPNWNSPARNGAAVANGASPPLETAVLKHDFLAVANRDDHELHESGISDIYTKFNAVLVSDPISPRTNYAHTDSWVRENNAAKTAGLGAGSDPSRGMSLSTICHISLSDCSEDEEYKQELAAIEMQYLQGYDELLRMRDDAIRCFQTKWTAEKSVSSAN